MSSLRSSQTDSPKFIQNEGCVGYSVLMLFSHLVIPSSWYVDRVSKIVSSRTLEPWEGSREVLHSQFTGHGFSEGCVSACLEKIFLVLLLFRACKYPKHRQFPPRNQHIHIYPRVLSLFSILSARFMTSQSKFLYQGNVILVAPGPGASLAPLAALLTCVYGGCQFTLSCPACLCPCHALQAE